MQCWFLATTCYSDTTKSTSHKRLPGIQRTNHTMVKCHWNFSVASLDSRKIPSFFKCHITVYHPNFSHYCIYACSLSETSSKGWLRCHLKYLTLFFKVSLKPLKLQRFLLMFKFNSRTDILYTLATFCQPKMVIAKVFLIFHLHLCMMCSWIHTCVCECGYTCVIVHVQKSEASSDVQPSLSTLFQTGLLKQVYRLTPLGFRV